MVYKIVWTPKALESYVANMEYLQQALIFYLISRKLAHREIKNNPM